MAWTTPLTAAANNPLTAAQWNASVRDNLNATATAVVTAQGQYVVATAATALAPRKIGFAIVNTSETTTATTATNLATVGPTVTVTSGVECLLFFSCNMQQSTVPNNCFMGFMVSGASTVSPYNSGALQFSPTATNQALQCSRVTDQQALTPGSNVFTAQYWVGGGTGTFANRHLTVMPF